MAQVATRAMRPYQWLVVALCFVINMLDGFDVLVMAFAASSVSTAWSLSGTQLGYLLSAGLVGMALGSLFIAPWADRFGRRPLILGCIALAGSGMLASSYAPTPVALGTLRLITGLGIGGILASSYVIAGEYANDRWRGLAISLQSTAYALGATIGGFIAAKIIPSMGWQSVFFYGGLVTLATLPLLAWLLPESLDFILNRQPRGALARANRILARLHAPALAALPSAKSITRMPMASTIAQLFSAQSRATTLLIWAGFFLVMFGFYFVMSWTPRLLVSAGLSTSQGITGGVLLNLGGIAGTALIGLLAARYSLPRLLAGYMLANALVLSVFVMSSASLSLAYGVALLIGIFVNGCVAGLYAMTPSLYPVAQRVTGLGWAIGIGRAGAIASPLVAGSLIDLHWSPAALYLLFAMAFVVAAMIVVLLSLRARPQEHAAAAL